jgi:hypothetical protein
MAASTQLITDLKTSIAAGQTANTAAAAQNANNKIQDVPGQLNEALLKLQEANRLLTELATVIDAGDPNTARVANILASLV